MALNLASLADRRAKLKFTFDGEEVNVEFYPHKITPEYRARLANQEREEELAGDDGQDSTAKMLSEILIGWDVIAGDEPVPTTYENLLQVPQTLIGRISSEIYEALGKLATPNRSKK